MNKISFPGLGIDEFNLDPVAFEIGDFSVRWYGIIICLGMILAVSYIYYRTKSQKLLFDDLLDLAMFTIPLGVIGARLYYIFTDSGNGSMFKNVMNNDNLTFGEKLLQLANIPGGGLAIYGGIIAGVLTVFFVCRHKKINILKFLDATAPAVMIAQAIGRWGNFFNAEAYGAETTLPWRMGIIHNIENPLSEFATMRYYHPTFLYESLWNVTGFILINIFYKKKKFDGQWFLAYVAWYGLGRAFIELLRTDSLWIFNHTLRVSTVVGGISFVVAVIFMIILYKKNKDKELSRVIYYADAKHHPDNLAKKEDESSTLDLKEKATEISPEEDTKEEDTKTENTEAENTKDENTKDE